ncbi:TIGR03773 family transporter-associated surface protein [Streptomyces sp. NPDC052225]|uniref:TIGR03773 family transporter-associated surface protein n=1 Tax=Streptomyces sp. NPDC052225 TaxID=3154949 RepID=UPI003429FC94
MTRLMRGARRVRIGVAVALAATLSGSGVAFAGSGSGVGDGGERPELGRIGYADGALSLDPVADAAATHVIEIGDDRLADASAPGWDTTGVAAGTVAGDRVRWSLNGVDGPGEVKVHDDAAETALFDSADAEPDAYEVPVGEQADTRWEFSAEGAYQVIFSAAATGLDGRELSADAVYTVLVGDEAIESAAQEADEAGGEGPVPQETASASPVPPARSLAAPAESRRTASPSASNSPVTKAASDVVAAKKVLDEGHIDFAARVVGGRLQIHVKDGTVPGTTTWREPSSLVLHVRPAAKKSLPAGGQFAFLGKAGTEVWLLDQVQQEGLLWPGWSTDNVKAGATKGDVRFALTGAEGPGAVALYTYDAMSGANVLFNSKDGGPDSFDVPQNTHAHGGWAFTEEGTYRLTLRMSGKLADGTAVSDTETVAFVVGGSDPSGVKPGAGTGSSPSPGSGSGSVADSGADASAGEKGSADGDGSMASTGAGNAALLGGAAAALAAAGAGFVVATRRRRDRGAGKSPA